jgi:hypothetical protein
MERRLLFGMAGVVMAVLFALLAQVVADARDCGASGLCRPLAEGVSGGVRG